VRGGNSDVAIWEAYDHIYCNVFFGVDTRLLAPDLLARGLRSTPPSGTLARAVLVLVAHLHCGQRFISPPVHQVRAALHLATSPPSVISYGMHTVSSYQLRYDISYKKMYTLNYMLVILSQEEHSGSNLMNSVAACSFPCSPARRIQKKACFQEHVVRIPYVVPIDVRRDTRRQL
jgi:hypothetical protein